MIESYPRLGKLYEIKTTNSINMRKTTLICLLSILTINSFAQEKAFQFGIRGGMNCSSAWVNDVSGSKFKLGYHIGATVDYQLSKKFLLQSGLFFTAKGSKQEDLDASSYVGGRPDWTHTFNQLYLEIPIYAAWRMEVSKSLDLILGAGPYFAYGIGGESKQKLNSGVWANGETQHTWKTFGDGVFDKNLDWLHNEALDRFDFGLGLKADLAYKRYVLGLGASMSLIDVMNNQTFPELHYRNINLSLSLGYMF